MITTLNLLSEGVSFRDLGSVIEQPKVNLFDSRLVLVRFSVLFEVWWGPWAIHGPWLQTLGSGIRGFSRNSSESHIREGIRALETTFLHI